MEAKSNSDLILIIRQLKKIRQFITYFSEMISNNFGSIFDNQFLFGV